MIVERYSNLKEVVGSVIPGCEISSLLDGKLSRWSNASYALALACRHFVSRKQKNKHNNYIIEVSSSHQYDKWRKVVVLLREYKNIVSNTRF